MDLTGMNYQHFHDQSTKGATPGQGQGHQGQPVHTFNFQSTISTNFPSSTQQQNPQNYWTNARSMTFLNPNMTSPTSGDGGGGVGGQWKRKVEQTDLLQPADLEYSEYRVTKMCSVEPMAQDQFFMDGDGFLWTEDKELVVAEEEQVSSTSSMNSAPLGASNGGGMGGADAGGSGSGGRGRSAPIKIAKRRSHPQT